MILIQYNFLLRKTKSEVNFESEKNIQGVFQTGDF